MGVGVCDVDWIGNVGGILVEECSAGVEITSIIKRRRDSEAEGKEVERRGALERVRWGVCR